jgi:glycosyltransferase involved in cell wall biosynthesis
MELAKTEMSLPDPDSGVAAASRITHNASRIRLVYCIDTMDVGGTELNAVRTAERLDRSRFELKIASLHPAGPLLERYRELGIPVINFPIKSLYGPSMLVQGLRFFRFLRREHVDLLHCHDLYANLFGAPWGRLARVPVVITSRRWLHPTRNQKLEVANRQVYRLAHRVLGNSPAVARRLHDIDGVPGDRILHVSNFVDDNAFQPMPAPTIAALRAELGALVFGCIARLASIKDHRTLLQALAILSPKWPQLHLVLIGDGERRNDLEQLAASLSISDKIHFAGTRPNDPNLHHLFDVSVLASLSEGFPNSLVEAMAAGRPVVATAVGGNVDAVRPETGLLVPPSNPAAFATAIAQLLANPDLRAQMGAAGRRVARAEYHAQAVIPQLENIYLQLLGSQRD